MYYFGICLMVWLTVGAITGIRIALIEGAEYRQRITVLREAAQSDRQLHIVDFFAFRRNFIAASALLGLFAFWLDTANIFREAKKSFALYRAKRKK